MVVAGQMRRVAAAAESASWHPGLAFVVYARKSAQLPLKSCDIYVRIPGVRLALRSPSMFESEFTVQNEEWDEALGEQYSK